MAKEIKIGILNKDKLEFEILEDAQKGDYINLNNINNVDFSFLIKQINEKKDDNIKQMILEEKRNWFNEFRSGQEYTGLNNKIHQLEQDNARLQEQVKLEYEKAENKVRLELNEQITKLKHDYELLKKDYDFSLTNKELEVDKKIITLKNDYENKIKEQENIHIAKIEQLQREKNSNIKVLGNELENKLQEFYNDSLGFNSDCVFEKTTKDIENTKPDFIFKVLDDDQTILGSVIIEAKTQYSTSDTNKKNKDYIEKLDRDRKKHNAEFSLLVTELEPNDVFVIKKENTYENMFIIRPSYFISFLSIIRFFCLKRKEIKKIEINFKRKQEISEEFDKLKNEILSNSVKHTNTQLSSILSNAKKIEEHSINITKAANLIMETHIKTIESKIQNFKINRIIKDIDKLEDKE